MKKDLLREFVLQTFLEKWEEKMTRTLDQVEAEIAQTKEALANAKGRDTEVYARIVGYYRSVRNWNKGKRDEYDQRKQFVYNGENTSANVVKDAPLYKEEVEKVEEPVCVCEYGDITSFEIFTRKTCPNCPPVKEYMANIALNRVDIDVDTEEGIARAGELGVFAAPTVVFFDANGNEVARAHSVSELAEILSKVCA